MKKKIITAQLTASKGKVIRQVSTGEILGIKCMVHPMTANFSDYVEVDENEFDCNDPNMELTENKQTNFDLSSSVDLSPEYVQTMVDNLRSGESITFSADDVVRFAGELILGEDRKWEDNKIVCK